MSTPQLTTAAMMTSLPPRLVNDIDIDPLGVATIATTTTMTATPAPYVDFRDELLFDPDELDKNAGIGGVRAPGDAILPVATTATATTASTKTQPPPPPPATTDTPAPVTINLLDSDSPPPQASTGPFGLAGWQAMLVSIVCVIACVLAVLMLMYGSRNQGSGTTSTVPELGLGGYGGTGF